MSKCKPDIRCKVAYFSQWSGSVENWVQQVVFVEGQQGVYSVIDRGDQRDVTSSSTPKLGH